MESPSSSIDSADEALYELLGIDKLNLEVEVTSFTDEHQTKSRVVSHTPQLLCHRPEAPHRPLLLQSTSPLLTLYQCNHIILLGGKASNDGGLHRGPTYIKAAQNGQSGASVQLQNPNHHKVCVFKNDIILKWFQHVFQSHFDSYIKEWCLDNNMESLQYRINPRLRLLRYDARDHDVFLPHYDATTTCEEEGVNWESKLTILIYLNTGDGSQFTGGKTLFLNSLQQGDHMAITPQRGQVVVFNHELYHASEELQYSEHIMVDEVVGGSKYVLRSDVMFSKDQSNVVEEGSELPTSVPDVLVESVLRAIPKYSHLSDVLDELEMRAISVKTLLVPGRKNVSTMLLDLGVEEDICEAFITECEKCV